MLIGKNLYCLSLDNKGVNDLNRGAEEIFPLENLRILGVERQKSVLFQVRITRL